MQTPASECKNTDYATSCILMQTAPSLIYRALIDRVSLLHRELLGLRVNPKLPGFRFNPELISLRVKPRTQGRNLERPSHEFLGDIGQSLR